MAENANVSFLDDYTSCSLTTVYNVAEYKQLAGRDHCAAAGKTLLIAGVDRTWKGSAHQ